MSRPLALALLLVPALVLTARGDDGPERPRWIDARTWESVKSDWATRWKAAAERSRLENAGATLVELEMQRRRTLPAIDAPLNALFADPELTALHAVAFAEQTAPRLSGHVVRIGAEGEPATLRLAATTILPGDTIVVGERRDMLDLSFRAPRRAPVSTTTVDLAIVGSGAGVTTLVVGGRHNQPVQRLRIEGVTLALGNRPLEVTGSWLHLRNCEITGFRTSAFHGEDAVLLLEDCTIDGKGLSDTRAFDLSGHSLLLVRRTRFVGVGTLAEHLDFTCAFDDCAAREWAREPFLGVGHVLARRSGSLFAEGASDVVEFEHATDDEAVIACAAGEKPAPDERSARLAGLLDLGRSLPYWIGLTRDARPRVRALAARRLDALAGVKAVTAGESFSGDALRALVGDLDADDWSRREEATHRLEAAGETARAALEAAARSGTAEQKERARSLLAGLRDREVVGDETEHARLLRWFEHERARLAWEPPQGKWIVRDFK